MRDQQLFHYSPITEREPIAWPDGARVAFYVGLNIEHFYVDAPSTSLVDLTTGLVPDALNYGWRDYGPRVGIWRLIEIFDRYGIRPSALLNSDVAERYPQIIAAGVERAWAWLAHGKTNSTIHSGVAVDEEREVLREIVETIQTGDRHAAAGLDGAGAERDVRDTGAARRAGAGIRTRLDQRRSAVPAQRARDAQRPLHAWSSTTSASSR